MIEDSINKLTEAVDRLTAVLKITESIRHLTEALETANVVTLGQSDSGVAVYGYNSPSPVTTAVETPPEIVPAPEVTPEPQPDSPKVTHQDVRTAAERVLAAGKLKEFKSMLETRFGVKSVTTLSENQLEAALKAVNDL